MLYEELRQVLVASDESEEQFERDIGGLNLIIEMRITDFGTLSSYESPTPEDRPTTH